MSASQPEVGPLEILPMLASALLLSVGLAVTADEARPVLRLHGSNTIGAALAPALAQAWLASEGATDIRGIQHAPEERTLHATHPGLGPIALDIRAHGTGTGFKSLTAGDADVAMASRPVTATELEAARAAGHGELNQGEQEQVLALDGLAIVASPGLALESLSLAELRDIYTGVIRDWSALGLPAQPIARFARDEKSGTFDTFSALVLAGAPMAEARRYEDNAALVADVLKAPNGIGFTGLGALGEARPLTIRDAVGGSGRPDLASVATEDYPLSRRLYLYLPRKATPQARRFVEFALSDRGQRVVEEIGFVSMSIRALPWTVVPEAPVEYRDGTLGHLRLSLNFRFGDGASLLDSRAERDLRRLAEFMRQPEYRDRTLRLFGFADQRISGHDYAATPLSTDRADYVARLLNAEGPRVERVRGLGTALPVASNSTETGRMRNRRVEVWIPARADLADRMAREQRGTTQ